MEHYTAEEIQFFYRACVARRQESLKDAAVAGRISQTDAKGWKESMRDIDRSVKDVLAPKGTPQGPKSVKSDDASLASFFGQIGKLPTKRAVQQEVNQSSRAKRRK